MTLAGAVSLGACITGAAALTDRRDDPVPIPQATLAVAQAKSAATALPAEPAATVGTPSGALLAEMTRRIGTPRQARSQWRRIKRRQAVIRARIRAARAAHQAAELARLEAEARRLRASLPLWFDRDAAEHAKRGPATAEEADWLASGRGGWIEANGLARAPNNAPDSIKRIIQAGNTIARSPYVWGGGHGAWQDKGYDCSGSVSFALSQGGLLGYSLTSGQLMNWGAPGRGRWLSVYASGGHVFLVVAGLRFDTTGRAGDHSTRWQLSPRPANGFAVRHYPGL